MLLCEFKQEKGFWVNPIQVNGNLTLPLIILCQNDKPTISLSKYTQPTFKQHAQNVFISVRVYVT